MKKQILFFALTVTFVLSLLSLAIPRSGSDALASVSIGAMLRP